MDFLDLDEVARDVLVVGVAHNAEACREFYEVAKDFSSWGGTLLDGELSIILKREPDNPNDSYAIRVSGKWQDADGKSRTVKLGYIPYKIAYAIGEDFEDDDKFYGEFSSIEPHEEFLFDIKINIYVKYS